MSVSVVIVSDPGEESRAVDRGTTGLDLFGDDTSVVAMRVNGTTVDLATELADGDRVEPVLATSGEGLAIIRHSAAHVTAQALQELFPQARLGIGPPITDGFYYDFKTDPLGPEDLKAIEKRMQAIIKQRQRFVRRVVTEEQALAEEADEPFKLELIADKGRPGADDGSRVEVGGAELTVYDNVRRDGTVAWKDLCRGPHVPNTGYLKAVALTRTSAAYWRGDQSRDTLQRVYGTAWASREDLKAHQERLAEAARRDHRTLGAELDLFSFPEEIGPGLVLFHPRGGILRHEIESYVIDRHLEAGFDIVHTPEISKGGLFRTSGHLPYYADTMFPPMAVDEGHDADGALTAQLCDEFGAHARAAFGVAHKPSTVFTASDGAAPSSTCVVSVSVSLLATSGAEQTMSLPSAPTTPIVDAIGAQVRTVEATVYEGRIVEASEGAQVDHDSERNGWETAVWTDTDEDLELTFDTSTGSTSSGASAGAPGQRDDEGSTGPGFYALVGAIVVLTIGALVVAFHAWARRTRGPRAR